MRTSWFVRVAPGAGPRPRGPLALGPGPVPALAGGGPPGAQV